VVAYSEPYGRRVTLRGTVPLRDSPFPVSAAIPDPPGVVARILREHLQMSGVVFDGGGHPAGSGDRATSGFRIAHRSAALPEIVDHLHRVSDNLEAQCLFLTMGQHQKRDPAVVVKEHWEKAGVAFKGLRLIDGSGLARANMIRPLDLARVNHFARRGPHGDRFWQSLTTSLDGKVRSKLGAMSGVKTEVGFLTLEDGREITFALMANGLDLPLDFWPLRDQLLRETASQLRR
jgi:D-alanyl-D-alanine carboxypeptidase/D-alanyl-D-alanine-endopeptidase (penicillin-binding protein 4)